MQLDLATAAGDGFLGALGIGIVTTDAFDAGITAVPGPFSDSDWDGWIWHHFFQLRGIAVQSQGADVAINSVGGTLRIPIDSKAMRIQSDNEVLFGMTETAVETGTAGMVVVADTRVLDKLP